MKQTTAVTSTNIINYTNSNKNKRNVQIFKRLQNYRKDTVNVATGTN